jgi:hypothetical protein
VSNMKKYPDQWTQKDFLKNKIKLEKEGIKVLLIDTILSPIDKAETTVYNRHELKTQPEESVFVFYCDSGKATLDRLKEYKENFPKQHCISLKGGRGYWRKNMMILDEDDNS